MRLALYGRSDGSWIRMTNQAKSCIYTSIEDALKDSERFSDRIRHLRIKDLDTKETIYQADRI